MRYTWTESKLQNSFILSLYDVTGTMTSLDSDVIGKDNPLDIGWLQGTM